MISIESYNYNPLTIWALVQSDRRVWRTTTDVRVDRVEQGGGGAAVGRSGTGAPDSVVRCAGARGARVRPAALVPAWLHGHTVVCGQAERCWATEIQ